MTTTPPLTPAEQADLEALLAGQHPDAKAVLATGWYLARARRHKDDEQ